VTIFKIIIHPDHNNQKSQLRNSWEIYSWSVTWRLCGIMPSVNILIYMWWDMTYGILYDVLCDITWYSTVLTDMTLNDVIWCGVMWSKVIWCEVMLCNISFPSLQGYVLWSLAINWNLCSSWAFLYFCIPVDCNRLHWAKKQYVQLRYSHR